jgi:hypothetical protein
MGGGRLLAIAVLALLMQAAFAKQWVVAGVVLAAVMGVFVLGSLRAIPEGTAPSVSGGPAWAPWVLIAVAAVLRFPFLDSFPAGFQIDEGNTLEQVPLILRREVTSPWRTAWWGTPTLPYFVQAAFIREWGNRFAVAHGVSTLFSLAAVLTFHRLCRSFLSPGVSLAASLMFAWSWWHLFFSISAFHNIMVLFCAIAAFLFLERAFREGRRADFLLTGVMAALATDNYLPGRLVPVMIVATCGGLVLRWGRPFLAAYGRALLLVPFGFLWFLGPFVWFSFTNPESVWGRARELSIVSLAVQGGDWLLPLKTMGYTALSFLWTGWNLDPRFGLYWVPNLDAFSGALFVVGGALTLADLRSRLSWTVLTGFLLALTANAFAVQGGSHKPDYLNQMRYFVVLPFAFLMAARGLEWVVRASKGLGPAARRIVFALLVAGTAGSLVLNAKTFYRDLKRNPDVWDSVGMGQVEAARQILRYASTDHVVVYHEYVSAAVRYLILDRATVLPLHAEDPVPLGRRASRDVTLILAQRIHPPLMSAVLSAYPGATTETVQDAFGVPLFLVVRVKKDVFNAALHGKAPAADLP